MYEGVCKGVWGLHGCQMTIVVFVSWLRVGWDIGSNVWEEVSAFDLYPEHAVSGSTRTMEKAGSLETSVASCKIHGTSV